MPPTDVKTVPFNFERTTGNDKIVFWTHPGTYSLALMFTSHRTLDQLCYVIFDCRMPAEITQWCTIMIVLRYSVWINKEKQWRVFDIPQFLHEKGKSDQGTSTQSVSLTYSCRAVSLFVMFFTLKRWDEVCAEVLVCRFVVAGPSLHSWSILPLPTWGNLEW